MSSKRSYPAEDNVKLDNPNEPVASSKGPDSFTPWADLMESRNNAIVTGSSLFNQAIVVAYSLDLNLNLDSLGILDYVRLILLHRFPDIFCRWNMINGWVVRAELYKVHISRCCIFKDGLT